MICGMTTLTTRTVGAFHLAHLDPFTGAGVLILPLPEHDVWLGPESLNGTDWDAASRELDAIGWEVLADDDDLPMTEDYTAPDGREVVALYGRDPILSNPELTEIAASGMALRAAVLAAEPVA